MKMISERKKTVQLDTDKSSRNCEIKGDQWSVNRWLIDISLSIYLLIYFGLSFKIFQNQSLLISINPSISVCYSGYKMQSVSLDFLNPIFIFVSSPFYLSVCLSMSIHLSQSVSLGFSKPIFIDIYLYFPKLIFNIIYLRLFFIFSQTKPKIILSSKSSHNKFPFLSICFILKKSRLLAGTCLNLMIRSATQSVCC